ncbi:PAC2 family protein [Euryarchaeota archaeon]|nr:proteasome assembly chaperone family protein [Candidatus Poseidoniaceae archaeon]MDA8546864.1 PAC2 family protein [Euryarchaeota archaeon]MDB2565412.1 PAC2 family protein [bacterium]MDA8568102.1 PAC2 family protein [Euryarchaeota archaeon]MDA8594762.1 PAC2 family protein [Euryarchaeota archaeon]
MERPSVRLNTKIETENAMVVACFPSIGMVSSVVAHFLIDHLDLEFVGAVVDPRLPVITLIQEGEPLPVIRAYAGKPQCTIEGCDQVILLMSELVIPEPLVNDIVWAMFEWSRENKIVHAVVIDAFAKEGMKGNLNGAEPTIEYEDTEGIDVVGIGANQKVRDMLKSMDITLLNQGVIKGINAAILSEARRRGLDLMSIMVEADPRWPDARAAATLIETLNKVLPAIDLPHQPLLEEAEFLESQIKAMMEGADAKTEVSTSNSMYG